MANDMLEKLKAFMESPEGEIAMQKFGEEMKRKEERETANRLRIEKMFTSQDSFDILMQKICDMHDSVYEDSCYKKGYQPHPNNVLNVMMNVFEEHGEDIAPFDELTKNFPSELVEYQGWQLAYTFGQGTCISVYKNKELMIRL